MKKLRDLFQVITKTGMLFTVLKVDIDENGECVFLVRHQGRMTSVSIYDCKPLPMGVKI